VIQILNCRINTDFTENLIDYPFVLLTDIKLLCCQLWRFYMKATPPHPNGIRALEIVRGDESTSLLIYRFMWNCGPNNC
jgi:hypothetical protein